MPSRRRPEPRRRSGVVPLTWEERVERRRLARRRLRIRRLGTLGVFVGCLVVLGIVLLGGGGRGETSGRAPAASLQARRRKDPPTVLPRGGRTVLPRDLVVAYYGIVGTSNILGQTRDPEADAAGIERTASAYARLRQRVQPAFELVTTIASPDPGPDGTYSSPIDKGTLQRYLEAAHRHRLLLILDFQPGRGDFLPQVRRYARFLLDPAVGVALDPEWKLSASQAPNQVIGASSADAINAVSSYLAALVAANRLPQKVFVVHEFRLTELPDRQYIRSRPGLATVLQMDGLGPVPTKLHAYRDVMRGAAGFIPGFKVFLRRTDDPVLLTPSQILSLHPQPRYISYQ